MATRFSGRGFCTRCHRDPDHDYKSRCIYLVTIMAESYTPRLSNPRFNNEEHYRKFQCSGPVQPADMAELNKALKYSSVYSHPTPAGEAVIKGLNRFRELNPDVQISRYALMPDHLHLIVFVRRYMEYPLGTYIGWLMAACSNAYRQMFPESPLTKKGLPLFKEGFNDSILRGRGRLKTMHEYVRNNPRRLLWQILKPEVFSRVNDMQLEGQRVRMYGNLFLLKDPRLRFMKVSRNFNEEELQQWHKSWDSTIREDGVLISAFIHKEERKILEKAIAAGSRIIYLQAEFLGERYHPWGRLRELCPEGRLLVISTGELPERAPRGSMRRPIAQRLNALGAAIADSSSA